VTHLRAGQYTVNPANLVTDKYFVNGAAQSSKYVYGQGSNGASTQVTPSLFLLTVL
jgi:hypothetical protein